MKSNFAKKHNRSIKYCKAEKFVLNMDHEKYHRFNYRELIEKGRAVFKADLINLVFSLRDRYMVDVFDLDSSGHIAYIDFDTKRDIILGYASGSPLIGLPFSNEFRKVYGKIIIPFADLRSCHEVGFFVETEYRNKGKKNLWNLDEMMMAIALEIAFEQGVEIFTINPTGDRANYYRNKFCAQIIPTHKNDIILGIDLKSVGKKLKHVEMVKQGEKTHLFKVKNCPDKPEISFDTKPH